jgi:hypothetical protein
MNLLSRPPGTAAMVLVVVVGLAIGGWLGVGARNQQVSRISRHDAAAAPARTLAPRTKTPAPTATPAVAATAAPTIAATAAPTVAATAAPTVAATAVPATAAVAAGGAVQGGWEIDEANVQVGTIVWSGSAVRSRANTLALDVHKVSVAGRSVSACERETELRAAVVLGAAAQTVPYHEVNCNGVASTGEVRVSAFSADGRSFRGSFWLGGAKLGDFDARATTAP